MDDHQYAMLGAAILIGWATLAAGIAACYPAKENKREYLKDWWGTFGFIPIFLGALSVLAAIAYLICSIIGALSMALFQLVT